MQSMINILLILAVLLAVLWATRNLVDAQVEVESLSDDELLHEVHCEQEFGSHKGIYITEYERRQVSRTEGRA